MASKFERVTRAAFNQDQPGGNRCSRDHGASKRRSLTEGLPDSIRQRAEALLKQAKIDTTSDSWLWGTVQNWGKSLFGESTAAHATRKAAAHLGAQLVTRIATALPTTLAGPTGLVLGEAVDSAIDYFLPDGTVTPGAPKLTNLGPRDWVAIDRGTHTHGRVNEGTGPGEADVLVISTKRTMFGDTLDIADPENEVLKRDLCLGFVVHAAAGRGSWEVFCLTSAKLETVPIQDLRSPTPQQLAYLEGNEAADTLRDLFFVDALPPVQQEGGVRTDPGAEVLTKKDGRVHYVVDSDGKDVLIEDPNGNRLHVSVDDLTRGRSRHDKSWNYVDGKVEQTSFDDTTRNAVYRGRWVWLDPSPAAIEKLSTVEVELGVVNRVQGVYVHAFAALTGEEFVVHLDDIRLVSPEDAASFANQRPLRRFREAVASDGPVQAKSVGGSSVQTVLLALGVMDGARAPEVLRPGETSGGGAARARAAGEAAREEQRLQATAEVGSRRPPAGTGALREILSLAERAGPGAGLRDAALAAYEQAMDGKGDLLEQHDAANGGGPNTMLFAAGALVVGYFVLSSL